MEFLWILISADLESLLRTGEQTDASKSHALTDKYVGEAEGNK